MFSTQNSNLLFSHCPIICSIHFQVLEVFQHPRDGAESAALTDSNPSREEEERHNRLITENNNIKQQIAEVRVQQQLYSNEKWRGLK